MKIKFFGPVMLTLLIVAGGHAPGSNAAGPGYPALRESFDPAFQEALSKALEEEFRGQYREAVETKKAAFVVVDITDLQRPRVAAVNPDTMLYAASLPKIAILLGAFVKIERGEMPLNDDTRGEMTRMIRKSSNQDATAVLERVGFEDLAAILTSEKYRLYDPKTGGGLWVGRDYSGGPVWQRDPLNNISHGATALQTARFYYLGITGRLVSADYRDELAQIMSNPGIEHKFVKGVHETNPDARIYRKSGTWKQFHADSGIIVDEKGGYRYIIVALLEHPKGADALARFAEVVDETVKALHPPASPSDR
jgi:beta-lactamase class A